MLKWLAKQGAPGEIVITIVLVGLTLIALDFAWSLIRAWDTVPRIDPPGVEQPAP